MRPAHLTPKLTDANRVEIRRLRAENPRKWTLGTLAERFGVNRSTITRALHKRVRTTVEQELAGLRAALEDHGPISTRELLKLKTQEWNRELLAERRDLGRQQQLVSLIKSVAPMIEGERDWRFGREPSSAELRAEREDCVARAIRALGGEQPAQKRIVGSPVLRAEQRILAEQAELRAAFEDNGSNQPMHQPPASGASSV